MFETLYLHESAPGTEATGTPAQLHEAPGSLVPERYIVNAPGTLVGSAPKKQRTAAEGDPKPDLKTNHP